jgi:periplasmic divalent cation tolerance protein
MAADYYQVVTTTDSQDEATRLASGIVADRLGACVQVMPVTSFYRWDGKVQHDAELRLVIKTAADRLDPLIAYLQDHHSYDVPQITATEIVAGSADYLGWITAETRP